MDEALQVDQGPPMAITALLTGLSRTGSTGGLPHVAEPESRVRTLVAMPLLTIPPVTMPLVTVPVVTLPAVTVPVVTVPLAIMPLVTVPLVTVRSCHARSYHALSYRGGARVTGTHLWPTVFRPFCQKKKQPFPYVR